MLDTAPLKGIWGTHAADGDATVGELDPPMLRRHRLGQPSTRLVLAGLRARRVGQRLRGPAGTLHLASQQRLDTVTGPLRPLGAYLREKPQERLVSWWPRS